MNVVRSILAVIAGYVVLSVLAIGTTLALRVFLPEITAQPPPFNYALLILAYITVFAVIAGYVTAVIARRAEVLHALGVVLLLFGILSVDAASGGGKLWFPVATVCCSLSLPSRAIISGRGVVLPNTISEAKKCFSIKNMCEVSYNFTHIFYGKTK